ncbi:hypothetical protein DVH05_025605 [Phytophthora capsici]|nr:hypothetical protein DVH05_025605 [Phytophthora capsici]
MQSVMRAIITAQSTQRGPDNSSTTQTRRQLVVQEDVIMNNSRDGVFSEALTAHVAHQEDDELQAIADYLNTSVATAEGRLTGLLQETLSATRFQFEATINEHMDRRMKELEGRLQERLQVAQRELEAATRSAFDQQSINFDTRISSSLAQAETTFSNHIIQLHDDCERRLRKSLGQCERLAESSAKAQTQQQTANIEERLQKLLNGEFNNHKTAFELQIEARFKDLTTTLQSDVQNRTSVLVDVQGEAIERRLQSKLDSALAASRADVQKYVTIYMNDVSTQLSQDIESAKSEIEAQRNAQEAGFEKRAQQLLSSATVAQYSAEEQTQQQTANIEERLQKLLNGEFNNHKTAFELQIEARFKDLATTLQSDVQNRTSVLVDVQGEAIERRLQSKLDSALAASRADVPKYVTTYMNDVSTQLSQDIESAKSEIEAQQNAQTASFEKLLSSTNAINHAAVAAIQTKFQDADLQTREYYQYINLRLDKMNYEFEQKIKSASEISEDQWVTITALIAENQSSNRGVSGSQDVQPSRDISTLDCVQEAGHPSKADDVLITPVDGQLVQQDPAVDILAALRKISEYVGNLKDNCELRDRNTLVKNHQPNAKENTNQSSSNATTVLYGIKKTPKILTALPPAKKTSETKSSPKIPKMSSTLAKARGEAIKAMHARTEARFSTMTCTKNVRSKEGKKSKK